MTDGTHLWGDTSDGVRRCVICGSPDFLALRGLIARMRRCLELGRPLGLSLESWHQRLHDLGVNPDHLDPWLPPEPTGCRGP